jgi:hypothetical protein
LGRFKNIEIPGLLIEDFGKVLIDSLNDSSKTSGLSEEALRKIAPKFDKLLSDYEESISSLYVEHHKFKLDAFLRTHINNQEKIADAHHDSFEAFILYINGCYNIYEKVIEKIKRKKIDSTLRMTIALYGLIIRRAEEILNQLLSGYIDGAMIIWRSLYENSIILLVLALENDNELADKYFQHSLRHSRRKILSYQNNHKELKFKPLPKSQDVILQTEIEKLNSRYGKDFLDNEHGWADNLFSGKQKANFILLEERVEMNRFNRLIEFGATENEKPYNVGGEVITATVKDPFGNVIGLIYNPHFHLKD